MRKKESSRILPLPTLNKTLVIKITNDHFGGSIGKGRRTGNRVFQRQATAYLLSVFTDLKNEEIGEVLEYEGDSKHSIVSYGIKRIKGFCRFCDKTRKQIIEIESKLEEAYDSGEKI